MSIFSPKETNSITKIVERIFSRIDQLSLSIDKQQSLKYIIFAFVALCFIGVIFFLNIKTPIISDDFVYSFVYGTELRIHNFGDIIHSQYLHYNLWGGRTVVHTIDQWLLMQDKLLIDVLNTLVFAVFIFAILMHIKGKRKFNISSLIFVFVGTWVLQPTFGETVLWVTGSCNYLWGTTIILVFLLPFRLYEGRVRNSFLEATYALCMFCVGIIGGWCTENTGAGMLVMVILFGVYYRENQWKLPLWAITGFLGALIGYFMMIHAPGNYVRAEGTHNSLFMIIYRFFRSTEAFVKYLGAANLGLSILFLIYLKYTKNDRKNIHLIFIYGVGMLCAIYSMVLSPSFPPRAWFGIITFNIIAAGIVFYNLNYSYRFIRSIRFIVIFWTIAAFLFSLFAAISDVNRLDKARKARDIEIVEKQKEGATEVHFTRLGAKTKFGLGDPTHVKKFMSQYYGFEFDFD